MGLAGIFFGVVTVGLQLSSYGKLVAHSNAVKAAKAAGEPLPLLDGATRAKQVVAIICTGLAAFCFFTASGINPLELFGLS